MVFCSCKKTTTSTTTTTIPHSNNNTPSPKRTFPLFQRKQQSPSSTSPQAAVAYLTTDLDYDYDDEQQQQLLPPLTTPAEQTQIKSVQQSKEHVDNVIFHRNRHSGQKTLFTGDGVLMFAGFRDWVSRKRLRERQMRGERYVRDVDTEGMTTTTKKSSTAGNNSGNGGGGGENETVMISSVQRIDPVKSGFMGKKTDRDEITGCTAGTLVAAQFAGRRTSSSLVNTTPRKVADNCTAATGCSPLSSSSGGSGSVERPGGGVEEGSWCGVEI